MKPNLSELLSMPLTYDIVMAVQSEKKLKDFVPLAWEAIEPQPFVDGWHIGAVCEHLQAVSDGQITNLIINIPPRHTKSLTTSVIWPAWEWGPYAHPEVRWMFCSYAASLSVRDSVKCRRLLQSPMYKKFWGHVFSLTGDQNAKERYDNDRGGYRLAGSVDGVSTGEGGDRLVVDDPHNLTDILSDVVRNRAIDWWDIAMATRLNNPKTGARVIIMQRGHAADLTGHIIETSGKDYEMLVLPAEFDPKSRCVTSLGVQDHRKKEGELLWPEQFDRAQLDQLKARLGTYGSAAQLQQKPTRVQGNIIQRSWWRYYRTASLPDLRFDFVFTSWDMTFKNTKGTDYVAGQAWGIIGANYYMLDRIKERLDFVDTQQAVLNLLSKWPSVSATYVEDKANGPAIISSLRNIVPGLIPVQVEGSKAARLFAVSPIVEAGNVFLPNPEDCPWVRDFIEEVSGYPGSPNDDEVDAFSQALSETRKRTRTLHIPPLVSLEKKSTWR